MRPSQKGRETGLSCQVSQSATVAPRSRPQPRRRRRAPWRCPGASAPEHRQRVYEEPCLGEVGRRLEARRLVRREERGVQRADDFAVDLGDEQEARLGVVARTGLEELGEALFVGAVEEPGRLVGVIGGALAVDSRDRLAVAGPAAADQGFHAGTLSADDAIRQRRRVGG
jgi:hypothetical protein